MRKEAAAAAARAARSQHSPTAQRPARIAAQIWLLVLADMATPSRPTVLQIHPAGSLSGLREL